jgi:hypothetical protein
MVHNIFKIYRYGASYAHWKDSQDGSILNERP